MLTTSFEIRSQASTRCLNVSNCGFWSSLLRGVCLIGRPYDQDEWERSELISGQGVWVINSFRLFCKGKKTKDMQGFVERRCFVVVVLRCRTSKKAKE